MNIVRVSRVASRLHGRQIFCSYLQSSRTTENGTVHSERSSSRCLLRFSRRVLIVGDEFRVHGRVYGNVGTTAYVHLERVVHAYNRKHVPPSHIQSVSAASTTAYSFEILPYITRYFPLLLTPSAGDTHSHLFILTGERVANFTYVETYAQKKTITYKHSARRLAQSRSHLRGDLQPCRIA